MRTGHHAGSRGCAAGAAAWLPAHCNPATHGQQRPALPLARRHRLGADPGWALPPCWWPPLTLAGQHRLGADPLVDPGWTLPPRWWCRCPGAQAGGRGTKQRKRRRCRRRCRHLRPLAFLNAQRSIMQPQDHEQLPRLLNEGVGERASSRVRSGSAVCTKQLYVCLRVRCRAARGCNPAPGPLRRRH